MNLSQNKLTNAQSYYVVNTTPNTVKLSLTANGSPINISACLDGKMIANIRGNEPINLVFGVYWTTN